MDDVFSERQTGAPGPSGPPQQYPPQHAAPHQHRGQIGYNNPQYNSRSGGGRSNDSMSVASQSHRSNAGGPNNNNPFNDGRRGSQNLRSVPAPANASNNAGNRDTSKGHEKDKQPTANTTQQITQQQTNDNTNNASYADDEWMVLDSYFDDGTKIDHDKNSNNTKHKRRFSFGKKHKRHQKSSTGSPPPYPPPKIERRHSKGFRLFGFMGGGDGKSQSKEDPSQNQHSKSQGQSKQSQQQSSKNHGSNSQAAQKQKQQQQQQHMQQQYMQQHRGHGGRMQHPRQNEVSIGVITDATQREQLELLVIKRFIRSYFEIVKKNIADLVPKSIMFMLVNQSKQRLQQDLALALYKEEEFERLLSEDPEIAQKRKSAQELLNILKKALDIINEVRDYKLD